MPKKIVKDNEVAVVEKNEVAVTGDMPMDMIDLGMIQLGVALKVNKKGNFVGKDVDGLDLGDTLVGVITKTTFEYALWRDEDIEGKLDEDANRLLIKEARPSDAEAEFDRLDDIEGLTEKGYSKKNIKGKVILEVNVDGSTYIVTGSPSSLAKFQKYAGAVLSGAYGNTKFDTPTPRGNMKLGRIGQVVTQLQVTEQKKGTFEWLCIEFSFVENVK